MTLLMSTKDFESVNAVPEDYGDGLRDYAGTLDFDLFPPPACYRELIWGLRRGFIPAQI
jgi:hypothetical protein